MALDISFEAVSNSTIRVTRAARLIIALTCLSFALITTQDVTSAQNRPKQNNKFTKQELTQVYAIIGGVLRSPQFLTPEAHQKFWSIMNSKGVSNKFLKDFREATSGWNTKYQKYFWQDAYHSLNSGQPYKSKYRANYEKRGLATKILSLNRVKSDNELISKIAAKQPIQYGGKSIVVTKDMIGKSMKHLEAGQRRMDMLFSRQMPQVMR